MPIPGSPPIPGSGGGTISLPSPSTSAYGAPLLPVANSQCSYSVIPSGIGSSHDSGTFSIWAAPSRPTMPCAHACNACADWSGFDVRKSRSNPSRISDGSRSQDVTRSLIRSSIGRRKIVVRASHTGRNFGAKPILCCTSCRIHSFQWFADPGPTVRSWAGKLTPRANASSAAFSTSNTCSSTGRPTWTYSAFPPM